MKALLLAVLAAACAQFHHAKDSTVHDDSNAAALLEASARQDDPRIAALLDGAGQHHDPNAAALLEGQPTDPDVEGPAEIEPAPQADQAFCCGDASVNGTGSNCVAIGSELINNCNSEGKTVLYCGGSFNFGDGKVTCID